MLSSALLPDQPTTDAIVRLLCTAEMSVTDSASKLICNSFIFSAKGESNAFFICVLNVFLLPIWRNKDCYKRMDLKVMLLLAETLNIKILFIFKHSIKIHPGCPSKTLKTASHELFKTMQCYYHHLQHVKLNIIC